VHAVTIIRIKQPRTIWPWRQRHYNPPNCQ